MATNTGELTLAQNSPLSMFDISGKSALVMGATGSFGGAAATALAQMGCDMTIADLNPEKLEAKTEELRATGAKVATAVGLPDSEATAASIVDAAVAAYGALDLMFVATGLPTGYTGYCASKAGLDGMVRALACEWGGKNANINAIGPTVFRSPLSEWMFSDEDPGKATREAMLERVPVGRLSETDDLMGGLIYLLSPASDYVTGHTLYIDGGYTAE